MGRGDARQGSVAGVAAGIAGTALGRESGYECFLPLRYACRLLL